MKTGKRSDNDIFDDINILLYIDKGIPITDTI